MMKITILGCGASGGVPLANGYWGEANFSNPKNRRTRSSLLIQTKNQVWIVDPGPDLRLQLLRHEVTHVDGVLLTHAHEDHILGVPDLSSFAYHKERPMPVYGDPKTLALLERMFFYCIDKEYPDQGPHPFSYHKFVVLRSFKDFLGKPLKTITEDHIPKETIFNKHLIPPSPSLGENFFYLDHFPVYFFQQPHGTMGSLGFRFPSFAYSTDLSHITEDMVSYLNHLDLWIVACTYWKETSSNHGNLEQVLQWIHKVQPEKVVLTHMSMKVDYDAAMNNTPANVQPAFDGMVLNFKNQNHEIR